MLSKRIVAAIVSLFVVALTCSCARLESLKMRFQDNEDLLGIGLAGWQQIGGRPRGWGIDEQRVLFTRGGHGGWLATVREYGDFALELEFKVPPGGNSGVFVRAPLEGDGAYLGMEIQLLDDYADKWSRLRPEQYTGSIYDVQAPCERAGKKAGEWQKMVIVCRGPKVKVMLNGTKIIDTNVDYYTHKFDRHPGLKRRTGYIGLQDHGSRVDFRNIRIRRL